MRLRPAASTPITIRSASEPRQRLARRRHPVVDTEGVVQVGQGARDVAGGLADEAGDELGAGRGLRPRRVRCTTPFSWRAAPARSPPGIGGEDARPGDEALVVGLVGQAARRRREVGDGAEDIAAARACWPRVTERSASSRRCGSSCARRRARRGRGTGWRRIRPAGADRRGWRGIEDLLPEMGGRRVEIAEVVALERRWAEADLELRGGPLDLGERRSMPTSSTW